MTLLTSVAAGVARLVTGANARFVGPPPSEAPSVYFANHASHLDFLAIWSVLPKAVRARTRPIAARDYWEATPRRRKIAAGLFRAILVDRAAIALSERAAQFDAMIAALDAGDSLILFPEGRRAGNADVEPFKSGLFHLARRRPAVPLHPVHLDNLNRVLPRGEVLLVPLLCCVSFGAPIALVPGEPKDAFLTRARDAVVGLRRS